MTNVTSIKTRMPQDSNTKYNFSHPVVSAQVAEAAIKTSEKRIADWRKRHLEISHPLLTQINDVLNTLNAQNISDGEISAKTGLAYTTIKNWRTYKSIPMVSSLLFICDKFNVKIVLQKI